MTTVLSIDPRTGDTVPVTQESTLADVDATAQAALRAAPAFEALGRAGRAVFLRAIADELEAAREEIVAVGSRETALPEARLNGELTRTCYQARLFADVLDDGGYLEATIDHAGDTPMGPGPDLRRMLVPLGPVAVFGASNFPLAFSVPGGDTISALAAGCPVVVKAHASHAALSQLTFTQLTAAARRTDVPEGTLGIVFGLEAGSALVAHSAIRAVGFTGSLGGGRALMDIAANRSDPIPFYGELASINPVIITEAAASARCDELADGLVASMNVSGGQLCTKPGVVLVPQGAAGDRLVASAAARVNALPASTLLNGGIAEAYDRVGTQINTWSAVDVVAVGAQPAPGIASTVAARLLEVEATKISGPELEECFGPTSVIIRYAEGDVASVVSRLPGSLTATIHSEPDETSRTADLAEALRPKAGRLLFSGWPTGVLVSWAQHHGGPWPSTNTTHTSVGTTSIRRFLRPVTWQSAPAALLPAELRDEATDLPRRVDGVLQSRQ